MTTALPECAGVFLRSHCPHPRLFEDEYKRSNRNRGTKILRCFPHCCPHHVDRSYCGSALEVLLRFGSDEDNREPFNVAYVFVFARFETVDAAKPAPDSHSLGYLGSVSQSEANPEGSWIEGVRQTAADRQQHSQQLHGRHSAPSRPAAGSSAPPKSATFVLNGQAYAKWYYHWESGANKVQRATKHALKAYVFYQTAQPATSSHQREGSHPDPIRDGALELLCVVTSPPFTVVSYRRAPLDASAAFAGSPGALGMGGIDASLMPHYATDAAQPVDSRLRRLVQNQISRAFQEYNQQQRRQDPRGSPDDAFVPFGDQGEQNEEEDQRGGAEPDQFDRYRRLQEREGLRFRLLTPEDAAHSGSSLHGQVQPRLVFDSTRQTQHWRDMDRADDDEFDEDYEEYDVQDDAVPQRLTSQRFSEQSASPYEGKRAGPVGMPPSTTDPVRQAERAAGVALVRYKQQKRQLDSHERELHELTDLAIVHFFVSRVSASHTGSLASLEAVFTIAISQHWRANGGSTQLARMLLTFANGGAGHGAAATASGEDCAHPKSQELMLVLGEVCVWAFSPENVAMIQSLLTACQPLLLDRLQSGGSDSDGDGKELRTAFLECVSRCWSALDGFLQSPRATQSAIRSVRQLSDAVLGVVYSNPAFEELRAGLRSMLQRPAIVLEDSKENTSTSTDPDAYGSATARCNLVGWQGFVAQVRESYLRDQYSGRGLPWNPTNSRSSRWAAEWLLQPNTISTAPGADTQWRPTRGAQASETGSFMQAGTASPRADARDVLSMWTSCLALSQLLHLKLAVAGDPVHTLYVQSEPSVLAPDNAWLRLICDGRVRLAPVAPNGLTSLMGGASCGFGGDYVAYRLDESSGVDDGSGRSPQVSTSSSDHSSIGVEFYWWPLTKTRDKQKPCVAFRSVVTLKVAASGAFMDGHLELERGFIGRNAVVTARSSEMELWAPTERVQSVATWAPWLSIEGVYARKGC